MDIVGDKILSAVRERLEAHVDGEAIWPAWNVALGAALQRYPEYPDEAERLALKAYRKALVERFGDGVGQYVDDSWQLLHILIADSEDDLAEFPVERMLEWRNRIGPVFHGVSFLTGSAQGDEDGTEI